MGKIPHWVEIGNETSIGEGMSDLPYKGEKIKIDKNCDIDHGTIMRARKKGRGSSRQLQLSSYR